ncbi:MAG: hypothetical protein AAF593_17520 [Planctomycetota bacterium]
MSIGWRTAQVMSEAEVRSHTTVMMAEVVAMYRQANNGAWPKDWADLNPYENDWGGIRHWPADEQAIRRDVEIDFGIDPMTLGHGPSDSFDAIRPRGLAYGFATHQAHWWVTEGWRDASAADDTIHP